MKKFKVSLKDGEKITFEGDRLVRDGQGVHIMIGTVEKESVIATFDNGDVASAYEVPA
ncbi:hypothetical protein [Rhizobium sp. Leaf383]|uniref:hypothetical protein n=1 Tax=Rhizobium sp. Leaf383 TaxID=1736357 RepID=UPI000AA80D26|nr:hypothetical protein [Rhizobium sp. Leaf383]